MALQNSGKITLDQVGKEFRGAKPYRMSDHYRGGSRVPSNIPGNYSPGNPGNYTPGNPAGCNSSSPTPKGPANESNFSCMSGASGAVSRSFSGSGYMVSGIAPCRSPVGMSNSCGGVNFNAGPWPGIVNNAKKNNGTPRPANNPSSNPPNPPTGNPAVSINTKVPTSGRIKLSNFYGGRKS